MTFRRGFGWMLVLATSTSIALAQTVGPGGTLLAPGPSTPQGYTPGGAGPGGSQIAPGPAARGLNIEQPGPGGTRMAPGPAGNVTDQAPVRRITPRRVERIRALETSKASQVRKAKRTKKVRATKRRNRAPVSAR